MTRKANTAQSYHTAGSLIPTHSLTDPPKPRVPIWMHKCIPVNVGQYLTTGRVYSLG
jgi:hypothetical protein